MYRRLLISALIAIFLVAVSSPTETPAAGKRTEDHQLPGLDGRVDAQFISAQKQQVSANVEGALPSAFDCKHELQYSIERRTCPSAAVTVVLQSRPLRI
jgi:hypothetical protein